MVPKLDPAWLATLSTQIAELERSRLEEAVPGVMDLEDLFMNPEQVFFSIEGLASFWKVNAGVDFAQHMTDFVVGSHTHRQSGLFVIVLGTPSKLSVFVSLGTSLATRTMLEGLFPGIRLREVQAREILPQLYESYVYQGILTGIPTGRSTPSSGSPPRQMPSGGGGGEGGQEQSSPPPSAGSQEESSGQLERVIRGMQGASWTYIVQAHPRPRSVVTEIRLSVVDLLASVSSQMKTQQQTTRNDNLQVTATQSGGQTTTMSGEIVNYRAQYLVRLLERELERLDRAVAAGQWTVSTFFGADNDQDVRRLASLLLGTMGGRDSRPDPLRAMFCAHNGLPISSFNTYLTSDEVATLVQFPREEVPGMAIHDFVLFDVDFRAPATDTLALGHIQQNGRDIHDTYNISLDALTKHAVVVGVTGSGKTTTVMNLLDRMIEAKRPFLVIEPAKTEYRALYMALADRAEIHIYTLGNENVAPFRLNPFEFETGDEPGDTSVLAHIDFLKAVFNASFVLYSPMPHVLEMALNEVYEDKGWDLASSTNSRIANWSERHNYAIFPTLTDIYRKIDIVTERLGYHDEIERNVKAGLKARVGSLRLGSKGLMLDTARGISMEYLLSYPTILEMEGIGSDEEKTFVMGLFLSRLYEYRRLQSTHSNALSTGLRHLIVFEEAHRLLKNTSTQVGDESANMRAQAIEMFTNMLSEIRAYGQGVLVAEQIPSKLAPDVLKNTNLKIVHRLIAQDDRQSLGQTMNLNEQQVMHLGVLNPGMAAVYAEGADHAYLVRFENYKRKIIPLRDSLLKQISPAYVSIRASQALSDMDQYEITFSSFGAPDVQVFQMADRLLETTRSQWLWANIMLRSLLSRNKLPEVLKRLAEYIEAETAHMSIEKRRETVRMTIVLGCAAMLGARGALYGWPYPLVEELRVLLTQSLLTLFQLGDLEAIGAELDQFCQLYEEHTRRDQGPFPGCVHCLAKCLYRSDVQLLLSQKDVARFDQEITSDAYPSLDERYAAAAVAVTGMADTWLGEQRLVAADVGYCAALHASTRTDLTEYEQILVGDNLMPFLLVEP